MSIHIKKSKVGSLRRHLGVKKGEKIPASKLSIKDSDSPAIRKKKQFAQNAAKWKKADGGELTKYPVGGEIQGLTNLLPALDFALPGVGSGLKAVSDVILPMLGKQPAQSLRATTSPTMQNGGPIENISKDLIGMSKQQLAQAQKYVSAFMSPSSDLSLLGEPPRKIQRHLANASELYDAIRSRMSSLDQGLETAKKIGGISSNNSVSGNYVTKKAYGGNLRQYNAPSHAAGGQMVDANGNPAKGNAVAEIEGKENILIDPSKKTAPYVFSERLGTAQEAAKINRTMKGDDQISRNGRKIAFDFLKRKNELMKQQQEQAATSPLRPFGGTLPGMGAMNNILNSVSGLPYANSPWRAQQEGMPYNNVRVTDPLSSRGIMRPEMVNQKLNPLPSSGIIPPVQAGANPLTSGVLPAELTNTVSGPGGVNQTAATSSGKGIKDLLPSQGKIGSILKGAAYLGSAIDALQPYEREKERQADFTRGDRLFSQTGASYQSLANEAIGQANLARQTAASGSRNLGQYMNRQRAISSATGRNLAGISLQQKQYNDQVAMQRGQREDMKAGTRQAEQIRAQTATSQNRAMRQDAIANLLNNVNNLGTEFQKQDYLKKATADMNAAQKKQFLLDIATINMQNPNFQIVDPAAFNQALNSGDLDQAMKLIRFSK